VRELVARERATGTRLHARDVAAAAGISERRAYELLRAVRAEDRSHDPAALSRLPGRPHCRHTGDVPAGMILAACRCLDCDPQPIQARLFSHALVENDLGRCADCGHQATSCWSAGPASPTPACARLVRTAATWPPPAADLANQERARWASHPSHALTLLVPALRPVTMVNSDR
jgi:hypothetical protein